jgi:hypothetical protein
MEKEKPQIQLNIDPNSYMITLMNIGFEEEMFRFLIASANQGRQFVATPKHAKRIYMLLKQQVEAYENKFGEIKTQLPSMPKNTTEEPKVGF